jgi:hypothetical protein
MARYCVDCGYHDADHDAPPGIPGVSPKFRQPTPVMQLMAECGSVEGSFYSYEDLKIVSLDTFAERFHRHTDRIKEILRHMKKTGRADSW